MAEFVAHIREDGAEQSVISHLEGTKELVTAFASAFGAEADASLAAMLHDVGKYAGLFQTHIRHPEKAIRVDHATAGAKEIGVPSPVSFAVAGHHGGLPDGGSRGDGPDAATLFGRLKRRVEDYSPWRAEQAAPPPGGPPDFCRGADAFTHAFYTRMLYSCLVDADYLDTERFMRGETGRGGYDGIPVLLERLNAALSGRKVPETKLNKKRREILDSCIKARRQNPMAPIKNRYEFVILFDVENGNPNKDPDAGNMPRVDPESGFGLVTDVCLKRKIRNYVETAKEDEAGYRIYIRENAPLNSSDAEACKYVGVETDDKSLKAAKKKDPDLDVKLRDFMCGNFFDVRTFGAVMTTFVKGALNCGQIRGPVQLGFARSVDPVVPQEITITRIAITTAADAENKSTEMGRKYIVPYGLYRAEGYISANLARKVTGFSEDDLQLLWTAILNMFENDRSAARGKMAVRELIVFKHDSELGNAPAYKLFDAVRVSRREDVALPRAYGDYTVTVDPMPEGVTCARM